MLGSFPKSRVSRCLLFILVLTSATGKRVSIEAVKGAKRDIRNVVELERVVVFRGGNDTDPVPQAVLLQELFGEILEVSLGEGDVGGDGDLVVPIADDLDVLAKLADLALDLDAVVQELFKVCAVEDTVRGGLRVVDDELVLGGALLGGGSGLEGGGEGISLLRR